MPGPRQLEPDETPAAMGECDVHGERPAARRFVARPQRHEPRFLRARRLGDAPQLARRERSLPGGERAAQARKRKIREELAHPINAAACRYQSTR